MLRNVEFVMQMKVKFEIVTLLCDNFYTTDAA